ncbi:Smr/MutS family protein [Emcibacter sp.]|uniref:Smr/MutS family protein n=1 Tax=Emcibacter sp. TaxID=1979954 RepID=UPI003A8F7A51
MARRPLTEEEKKLWSIVTRDVKIIDNGYATKSCEGETNDPGPNLPPQKKPKNRNLSTPQVKNPPPEGREVSPPLAVDHNWQQKLRRGRAPVEGKIDLHGMTQDRAYRALSSYISRARSGGKRVILVVTGKGGPKRDLSSLSQREYENRRGVLRDQVPNWLSSGELRHSVVSFFSANREHGGEGALYVILRKGDR